MKRLFQAVNHMHASNICHRDLKPENILFVDDGDASDIKLIDFGLSS
jgi:serine/threonine protein kinase